jgi:hypothetical protein
MFTKNKAISSLLVTLSLFAFSAMFILTDGIFAVSGAPGTC